MLSIEQVKSLDKAKVSVFRNSNSAFYGSLLSSVDMTCNPDQEEPARISVGNKLLLTVNDEFLSMDVATQKTILIHELNHLARLHPLRQGAREQKKWDQACDIEINNQLEKEAHANGYSDKFPLKSDPRFRNLAAEEIYLLLKKDEENGNQSPPGWEGDSHDFGGNDSGNESPQSGGSSSSNTLQQLGALEKATQAAQKAGESTDFGAGSQAVADLLRDFKNPLVNWKTALRKFFKELTKNNYSFNRPNRRFEDVYLPSLQNEESNLSKISFYVDCSASVSEKELKTMLNEFKYIKDSFNPEMLELIQFDTQILREDKFPQNKQVRGIDFVYGGGTDLVPVRDHIINGKPKVAIIMSDLYVRPMEPVKGTEIVWLVVNNRQAEVNQGKMIHIEVKNDY